MRYIRPFDRSVAGPPVETLVAAEEGVGCTMRLRRGAGSVDGADAGNDRFVLPLIGEATLRGAGGETVARASELIVIPAGAPADVRVAGETLWLEVIAPLPDGARAQADHPAQVVAIDPSKWTEGGFAYQSLTDRSRGSQALRMNILQVQPGSGSPDWHIHAFAQMYVILEGEMTIDIGRARVTASAGTLVIFPPGVVHRNFNASGAVERHVTFLVPEPAADDIFDYAVTIHEHEAALLTSIPA
ncbi:cupin domain-containing protein [Sphingomonas adhaesiva]|uniref:cupin domain-containing protein n=1 Tax=Sphingomonas adhaesiva TaxID=28212 RepID=UPI002FFA95F1